MAEHNHLTRDIKPLWSGCHGCDEYHVNALQMRIAALLAERDAARAEADKWQTLAVAAQMARDDLLAESAQGTEDHGGR